MLTSNPDCTICGRSVPMDEWARFRIEETEVGKHVIVACALHTDEEVAGTWHYNDDGSEDYDATEIEDAVDDPPPESRELDEFTDDDSS